MAAGSSRRRPPRWARLTLTLVAGAAWAVADAAVVTRAPAGFLLTHQLSLSAGPDRVYQALTDVAAWWNPDHTYSGDAAMLSMDPRAGGCFCEKLPGGGSVEHMRVVFAAPGKLLRLAGGLGPLQAMGASGVMEFALRAQPEGHTLLSLTYTVGGFSADGLDGMAEPVDGVLAEQLARLATLLDSLP